MNLKEMLIGLEGLKARGKIELDIKGIAFNSKEIQEGYIFVAIKGFETDGHKFVEEAIENGAVAIVIQEGCDLKSLKIPADITVIMAKDTREALAIISCNYYKNPSTKLKLIGITGTKGKTTTTYMVKKILEKAGKKVGLIGTIETEINGKKIKDNDRTTPESLELQQLLDKMVKEGVEIAVMEVSSQSLKLHRVTGCVFDIAVFTNFAEDHISPNEHSSMEDYLEAKLKIFDMCKQAVVNADDLQGSKMRKRYPELPITTYGIDNWANLLAKDITITNSYVDFKVKLTDRNERVKTGIPGRFSVYNSLASICIAQKYGVDSDTIKEALAEVRVPGRSEMVDNKLELPIMIDYAHTPESLKSILSAVKIYTRGKVIVVFGCGGNRDSSKRPAMGEVAGKTADYIIITSDNVRNEEPEIIAGQIEDGIKKTKGKYEIILDRREAIKKAISMTSKRDIVVLAGKGHETEQEIGNKKYPFDERKIVREIIKELN